MTAYADRLDERLRQRSRERTFERLARHGFLDADGPIETDPVRTITDEATDVPTPPMPTGTGQMGRRARRRPPEQTPEGHGVLPAMGRGLILGGANFAQTISDLSRYAAEKTGLGDAQADADPAAAIAQWLRDAAGPTPDDLSARDQFIEDASKWLAVFATTRGMAGAARTTTEAVVKGATAGGIADFTAFEKEDANLSTFLAGRDDAWRHLAMDALVHDDDDDSPLVWRAQNLAEGLGLGLAAEGVAHLVVKGFKAAKAPIPIVRQVVQLRETPDTPIDRPSKEALDALKAEVEKTAGDDLLAQIADLPGADPRSRPRRATVSCRPWDVASF